MLMIRFGTRRDESIAEDLHVARHHHELDTVLVERAEHGSLLLGPGVGRHGKMEIRNPHVGGEVGVIRVVRHDDSQVHREFAVAPSRQQVVEAVWLPGRHDRGGRRYVGEAQIDVHLEPLGDRCERVDDLGAIETEALELELDALEEDGTVARSRIDVLLGVDDVAVVLSDELGGGGHHSSLVGAGQQEYGGHGRSFSPDRRPSA